MTRQNRPTFRDWIASRMIRFNAIVAAISTAALPIIFAFDASDWQTLGLTPKQALIAVLVVQVVSNGVNMGLRSVTTKPLAGRSAGAHDPEGS